MNPVTKKAIKEIKKEQLTINVQKEERDKKDKKTLLTPYTGGTYVIVVEKQILTF